MMKRIFLWVSIISLLSIGMSSCSRDSDSIVSAGSTGDLAAASESSFDHTVAASFAFPNSVVLNGYLVTFDGRTYENDQTTFHYTVAGMDAEHALSHFFLELPDCAPMLDSYMPSGGIISVDPLIDVYGIKWDLPLGTNESRSYSITFPGDIPLGFIRACVKASTLNDVGYVTGPCFGFEISGTVFIDADSSGTYDELDETGIIDVTVTLADEEGNNITTVTDANGDYAFLAPAGTFTLRIDAETPDSDFNEELDSSFDPTGPTSIVVSVGPDSPDNDFGFDPRAEEITLEIEQGFLLTTGEPAKFWKKELSTALRGSSANTEYDAAAIADFIAEIQELFLPDPFQFTPGNEFQEALDILSIHSKDPLLILQRELLTAEFNHVSGKGLVDASELQGVMIAWAESVYIGAAPSIPSMAALDDRISLMSTTESRVPQVIDFLIQLNGSTAGGSGGGG